MKTVIQRVTNASVKIDNNTVSLIKNGLLVLIGIGQDDKKENADYLAKKISSMRIFEDENEKMNLSVKDINGSILVVSQFTLYADCRHGNRPSFTNAASPTEANILYQYFCSQLKKEGVKEVVTGVFGANMAVELLNNGPVTIILEKEI